MLEIDARRAIMLVVEHRGGTSSHHVFPPHVFPPLCSHPPGRRAARTRAPSRAPARPEPRRRRYRRRRRGGPRVPRGPCRCRTSPSGRCGRTCPVEQRCRSGAGAVPERRKQCVRKRMRWCMCGTIPPRTRSAHPHPHPFCNPRHPRRAHSASATHSDTHCCNHYSTFPLTPVP